MNVIDENGRGRTRLEIVHIRFVGNRPRGLTDEIGKSVEKLSRQAVIRLYDHSAVSTDMAVHIEIKEGLQDPYTDEFGVRLADSLKEYGMVEHSVWFEKR